VGFLLHCQESLKEGDKVAVSFGYMSGVGYSIKVVSKATKTQITLTDGEKYNKKNGYRTGSQGMYRRPRLVQITPEILNGLEKRKLIGSIRLKMEHVEALLSKREITLETLELLNNTFKSFPEEF